MAKIVRKTAKIFGAGAPAGPTGIGVFGSLAAGSIAYSTDPAAIQAPAEWSQAWPGAVIGGNSPAMEDMNAVQYVASYQNAYLLQQGIPEYDSGTTYFIDGFCSYLGSIYKSLTDNNLANLPSTSPSNWTNLTPATLYPPRYISGLQVSWASATTLGISAGFCNDSTDAYSFNLPSAVVLNSGSVGANGIDAGSLSASTWYYVFAIGDSTGANPTATLLSASLTVPTMPSGYNIFRHVGTVRSDGSAMIKQFIQSGKQSFRETHYYNVDNSDLTALSGGTATSFTAVPLSSFAPPTTRNVFLGINLSFPSGDIGCELILRPTGTTASFTPYMQSGIGSAAWKTRDFLQMPTDSAQSIDYKTTITSGSGQSGTIIVEGWIEEI